MLRFLIKIWVNIRNKFTKMDKILLSDELILKKKIAIGYFR